MYWDDEESLKLFVPLGMTTRDYRVISVLECIGSYEVPWIRGVSEGVQKSKEVRYGKRLYGEGSVCRPL
jgi:hypothetical protein